MPAAIGQGGKRRSPAASRSGQPIDHLRLFAPRRRAIGQAEYRSPPRAVAKDHVGPRSFPGIGRGLGGRRVAFLECRRQTRGDKTRQATIGLPPSLQDRRREVAAASDCPALDGRSVETAAHHLRGRRLPVEHDSPLGPVAAVHRAPGNPRMPADRRGCLEDVGGRATGLRNLRDRCRNRCFPVATSHGGAGGQRHGDPAWAKAR